MNGRKDVRETATLGGSERLALQACAEVRGGSRFRKFKFQCESDQIGPIGNTQLRHDSTAVRVDGFAGQGKVKPNIRACRSSDDAPQYLALTCTQKIKGLRGMSVPSTPFAIWAIIAGLTN